MGYPLRAALLAALFLLLTPLALLRLAPRVVLAQGGPAQTQSSPGHDLHSVTVTFDYDFTLTPACNEKIRERCVARFVAYDISGGPSCRARLFVIPVPQGAKGRMHGIAFTGPKREFESGKHQLAVAAQEPSGVESKSYAATVWIVIP